MSKAVDLRKKMDDLANSIVTDPARLKEFALNWTKGFHSYSFGNLCLIYYQKPNAALCAGFNHWKKQGRHVKAGEKAIWILAPMKCRLKKKDEEVQREDELNLASGDDGNPEEQAQTRLFFRGVPVFDISQTDGKPVELGCSNMVSGDVSLDTLINLCPYPVRIQDEHVTANGSTDGLLVELTRRGNETSMAATLFHEWAHIELKHPLLISHGDALPKDIKELEAEAVSYLVCSAIGIDNQRSALYIGHYGATPESLGKSGSRILAAAEKILKVIKGGTETGDWREAA